MRKKILVGLLGVTLILGSCGKLEKGTSSISPGQTGGEKIATTGQIDSSAYQTLLVDGKYKTAKVRGLSASILNSNYNSANLEKGLIELSKQQYAVDKFYFQEGQFISREGIIQFLNRQSAETPEGLNPADKNSPIVLEQILEQNYINQETEQVEAVSLGIALNSVDYSGETPQTISDDTLWAEGKIIANKVLEKVRTIEGLEKVSITIGLFKQSTKDDIGGGNYFATATSKSGTSIDAWEDVNETHIVLPVKEGIKNSATDDGLSNKYNDFKNSVQSFFPNSSGISGVADYRNNELQKLTIVIETKYFSETEILNFTQFISQTVDTVFPINGNVEVQINTLEGPQAFVQKKAGTEKSEGHIFN